MTMRRKKVAVPLTGFFRTRFLLIPILGAVTVSSLVAGGMMTGPAGPDPATPHIDAGLMSSDHESALTHFKKALEANPESASARRCVGMTLVKLKRPFEAITHLMACLKESPDDAEVLAATARAYRMEQNPDVALIYYGQACSAAPQWVNIHKETARVLMERGRAMEAVRTIQLAMRHASEDPELPSMLSAALAAIPTQQSNAGGTSLTPELGPQIPNPLGAIEQSRKRMR